MQAHALRALVLQTVVQPLVVAEIEAVLLQLPLHVPVGFGNEQEVRVGALDRRNHVVPVLGRGSVPGAAAPGPLEHVVQQQHRHVAANAVALSGNVGQGFDHRLAQAGLKGIQLQDVRPGRKVGIASAGQKVIVYLNVGPGRVLRVPAASVNEVVEMLR